MGEMTLEKIKGNMCRWPIGDPKDGDFHFCGNPSEPSHSYCPNHMDIAHTANTRKRVITPKKIKSA